MQLADMKWTDVAALSRDTPIVFPVAALEQHGRHMPLFTDSMLLGEVVRRAAERLADRVVFAPLVWLGNSDHHLDFPGTLSAPPRMYLDMLGALLDNFIMHGFRRLVFINGHGGNVTPGKQAVFEARQRYRQRSDLMLLFATYWDLGGKPTAVDQSIHQPEMGHACEWETSMMLRIAPHLVSGHQSVEPVDRGFPLAPATRGWTTKDRSDPGHMGDPRNATAEKGETLFRVFSDDLVKFLEKVASARSTGWWDG